MAITRAFIGIDNGVTGSVGILVEGLEPVGFKTPTKKVLNYTKQAKNVSRLEVNKFEELLQTHLPENKAGVLCSIERPMVNPGRFQASLTAVRCLEATLNVLEKLAIPYEFIDSKQWQKALLPSGLKGDALKHASLDVGKRLFPSVKHVKDADGILIAEWLRRQNVGPKKEL